MGLNVHPRHYSIGIEIKDNAINIERLSNGKYDVYYLERGEKNSCKTFDTETEALDNLIERLETNIRYGLDLSE